MPTKRKFSAKFPTARIKKIMQLDDDVGKVAATVPPVVSRAMELMVEQLLGTALSQAKLRNSKTVTASHLKFVIESDPCLAFARKLVASVAELKTVEDVCPAFPPPLDSAPPPGTRGRGRGRGRGARHGDRPARKERASKPRRRPECEINRELVRSQSAEERCLEDQKLNGVEDEEVPRKRLRKSVTVSIGEEEPDESDTDTASGECNGEESGVKEEGEDSITEGEEEVKEEMD